jgi:hypothetical protein
MNGNGTDIFPIPFTAAQANYAIANHGVDATKNTFNARLARDWLIANYETVDAAILATDPTYSDNPNDWTSVQGVTSASCGLIQEKDVLVSGQVQILQDAFKDISGYVLSTMQSKAENAKIQAMLFEVCKDANSTQWPACAKLATIDFDLFYTNPTHSTLADLETLNIKIYERRNEVCAILHNIRTIKNILGCSGNSYPNPIPECSEGCNIDNNARIFDCSNSTIFDTNNIGGLRYSLEQLSPLFDVPAYSGILTDVLDKLSYVVETPSLLNFTASDANMRMITSAINDVKSLINNDYASATNNMSGLTTGLDAYNAQNTFRTSTELF